ncbi:MAG TPA: pyridoxal-phosphate dependent enzyme [Polyangia bacterium]|nr:pyridoxal-phosphate dependent enzyme [Polyangia bacterium]
MEPALFRQFPGLRGKLPWESLGSFPTPVARLRALGAAVGVPDLWIKRDDQSGTLYGGNKVRKLEFLLADVRRRGRGRVLTMGAFGSHQVLATALYGARLGLRVCALVFPQPPTDHARDTLLLSLGAGACLHRSPGPLTSPVAGAACAWRHRAEGLPAFIAPGGSTHIGTLGYVSGALELAEQVRAGTCPEPDLIVVALGSGGTAAGLLIGLRLAGLTRPRVLAVRVYDRFFTNRSATTRLANRTAARLRAAGGPDAGTFSRRDLEVDHDFFGGAYGRPTPAAQAALARLRDLEGITLETTYTGKALAALIARAPALAGRRVLFWNTFNSVPTAALPRPDPATLPRALRAFLGLAEASRRAAPEAGA